MKRSSPFENFVRETCSHFCGRDYFVCVYGSMASGHQNARSDIDLMAFAKHQSMRDFIFLFDNLVLLHRHMNLTLDAEVPYRNKLLVSYRDVDAAVRLTCFPRRDGHRSVPPIRKSKRFLASRAMRLRLILNVLTSPHELIAGSRASYDTYRERAEQAICKLALDLAYPKSVPPASHLDKLLYGECGQEGELHLGYRADRPMVVRYVRNILTKHGGQR
jgi:predicted nucleotidyltransferase